MYVHTQSILIQVNVPKKSNKKIKLLKRAAKFVHADGASQFINLSDSLFYPLLKSKLP